MRTSVPSAMLCLEAFLASACLTVLYHATAQGHYWGDAKFLMQWVGNGRYDYYHLAYLPLAQLLQRSLGALCGFSIEDSLRWLSILSAALSGGVLHAAMRSASVGRLSAAAATGLYALAPVVWFFATAIEIHAVQMLAVAGVCLWAVRASRSACFGANPVAVVVALCAVVAGHLSGISWTPAAVLILFLGARSAERGRWLCAGAMAALFVAAFLLLDRSGNRGAYHLELGLRALLRPPSLSLGWRELFAPGGVLWALAALTAWIGARRGLLDTGSLELRSALALVVCTAPLAFLVDIAERGAYFVSLLPVIALWLALAAERVRALALLCLLALPVQGWLGYRELRSFEDEGLPTEFAWVYTLEQEGGAGSILLTSDAALAAPVQHRTSLTVFVLTPGMGIDLAQETVRARVVAQVLAKAATGARIALTNELPTGLPGSLLIAELTAALGPLVPGRDAHYSFLPGL